MTPLGPTLGFGLKLKKNEKTKVLNNRHIIPSFYLSDVGGKYILMRPHPTANHWYTDPLQSSFPPTIIINKAGVFFRVHPSP